jgi:hypothetical protein
MVSSGIAERFRNWKVSKEATISDHNRIYMDMMTGIPSLQLGRNLKKVDWDEFRDKVNGVLLQPSNTRNME